MSISPLYFFFLAFPFILFSHSFCKVVRCVLNFHLPVLFPLTSVSYSLCGVCTALYLISSYLSPSFRTLSLYLTYWRDFSNTEGLHCLFQEMLPIYLISLFLLPYCTFMLLFILNIFQSVQCQNYCSIFQFSFFISKTNFKKIKIQNCV